jgi:hypothetical protein
LLRLGDRELFGYDASDWSGDFTVTLGIREGSGTLNLGLPEAIALSGLERRASLYAGRTFDHLKVLNGNFTVSHQSFIITNDRSSVSNDSLCISNDRLSVSNHSLSVSNDRLSVSSDGLNGSSDHSFQINSTVMVEILCIKCSL